MPLHRAHLVLRRQGIQRAGSGNPLAASAPWKRRDLHRLGQADCERLGGIFYFRILGFNVRSSSLLMSLQSLPCKAHMACVLAVGRAGLPKSKGLSNMGTPTTTPCAALRCPCISPCTSHMAGPPTADRRAS